jgi:hypothetical protein
MTGSKPELSVDQKISTGSILGRDVELVASKPFSPRRIEWLLSALNMNWQSRPEADEARATTKRLLWAYGLGKDQA